MFIFNHKRLIKERLKRGMTYGQLEKELRRYESKASKSIIYNWERGAIPSSVYLMILCKIFGKKADYFMNEVKKKSEAPSSVTKKRPLP